jgi:hypothetical protein
MRSTAAFANSMPNEPLRAHAGWGRAAAGLAAGLITQGCFYYFWQLVGHTLVAPSLTPFGRTPDQLVAIVLPFLGGLVAASYHRRGWWWLGQFMALPAFAWLHVLFVAGIQLTQSRPPTLTEEGRFLLAEGPRLLAGFLGSYLGALLQGD